MNLVGVAGGGGKGGRLVRKAGPAPQGEAQVASSVGIALSPTHGSDAATLEEHADQALYVAKRGGGNRWCVYSHTVAASATDSAEGRRRH